MTTIRTLLLVMVSLWGADGDRLPGREVLDQMHASMAATFKRDRGALERFYSPTASIVEAGRVHTGRAAVQAYWTSSTWLPDWSQDVFAVGAGGGTAWVAGRITATRTDRLTIETFFIRLLSDQGGEWRIIDEVLSGAPGTGTPAEIERAVDEWVAAGGGGQVSGRATRLFGALAVSTSRVTRNGEELTCATTWIQDRQRWRQASARCQPLAARP